MKIRTRNIFTLRKNRVQLDNLRAVMAFKMQSPRLIPNVLQFGEHEREITQRLIALEVERKQSIGRTYANMLPAR